MEINLQPNASHIVMNLLFCSQVLGGESILIICLTRMTWCSLTSHLVLTTRPLCRQALTSEHCVPLCYSLVFFQGCIYSVAIHGHFLSSLGVSCEVSHFDMARSHRKCRTSVPNKANIVLLLTLHFKQMYLRTDQGRGDVSNYLFFLTKYIAPISLLLLLILPHYI